MERKNTKTFITTLAILIVSISWCVVAERELIAVGQCIGDCVSRCTGSQDYEPCYNGCARGCIPVATTTSSYYCNLGCSLRQCSKIAHDANMLKSCLDDCSKVQCIEA